MQIRQRMNSTVLITGSAGFIGSNLVLELLKSSSPIHIIGIDNLNDYYDVSLKEYRLKQIEAEAYKHPESSWTFIKGSIADKSVVDTLFLDYKPEIVVIWLLRRGSAIRSQIRMPILSQILLVFIIF